MRLEYLSRINMGQSPVGESLNETVGTEFHQGKIYFGDLFLQHSPIKTKSPTKLAKAGDILICVRAPVGVVNITDREVCIGRGLAALTPKENVPARFLFHLLRHKQATLEQMSTGSTFASITTDQLRAVDLPVPDKATWLHIAGILGSLDEKIEINRRKIAELESFAKTIYDYWFVQFDFPDANGFPYKSSGGKMVWNEHVKKEIPFDWDVMPLGSLLARIPQTKRLKTDEYSNKGLYPILDQSEYYIVGYTNELNAVLSLPRCVVFGDHSCTVKLANFPFCRGADGTQIIVSKDESLCSTFQLYFFIKDLVFDGQYKRHFSFLKQLELSIPKNIYINNLFFNVMDSLYNSILNCRKEIKQLVDTRDTLLPLLINGQVKVAGLL